MTHEDHDRLVTDTVGQDLDKYARRSARLDVATRVLFFVALLLLGLFAAINIY